MGNNKCCKGKGWKPHHPSCDPLLAWLENDLPDEEAQLVNSHVADCEECREKLALMNAVQDVSDDAASAR